MSTALRGKVNLNFPLNYDQQANTKMTDANMRTRAIFERKVGLSPKELNKITLGSNGQVAKTIDDLLIEKISAEMNGKCSQHGWVIPGTLRIISRSMCQNEAGRFTGAMVSWVQVEGDVYYPSDKMEIVGEVLKKNKMGMFVVFKNAIQIMIPRDLHLADETYDSVQIGQYVNVEIKKSRFQVNDPYILSVGIFKGVAEKPMEDAPAVATTGFEAVEPVPPEPVLPVTESTIAPLNMEKTEAIVAAAPEESKETETEGALDEQLEINEAERPAAATPVASNPEGQRTGTTVGSFF